MRTYVARLQADWKRDELKYHLAAVVYRYACDQWIPNSHALYERLAALGYTWDDKGKLWREKGEEDEALPDLPY